MVRQRNIALAILFSIITCGIYALYWFVCLTDDTNNLAQEYDTSGAMALVLTIITCGIYGFYWAYKRGEKLDRANQAKGFPASNSGILYVILYIFGGIITYAIIQNEINKLADTQ